MRLVCLLVAMAAGLSAQEYRGTFSGTITDPTGAAIVKATVTATETRTGTRTTATAGDSGAYTIPFLAPGTYEITAEASGFKKSVRSGITLSSGDSPVIDFRLEVGSITDAVTITAEAPILEASSPTLGQVLSTKEVDALPVNGRTPMMVDQLAFGVVSTYEPGPVFTWADRWITTRTSPTARRSISPSS